MYLSLCLRKKIKFLFLLQLLCFLPQLSVLSQEISRPEYVLKSHETLEIIRIVRDSDKTMFHLSIRNELDEGGHFCIDNNTILIANGKKYKLEKHTGIPECPEKHEFLLKGESLNFLLYFPPLPENTLQVDLVENCEANCLYVKGVVVNPELQKEMILAFDFFESGMFMEAISSYKDLITKYSGKADSAEALFYFYIITILNEIGNDTESDAWIKKFREADLPESDWVLSKLRI